MSGSLPTVGAHPFLVVTVTLFGLVVTPAGSARAAQTAAHHLREHDQLWAIWLPSLRLAGPVVVFAATRSATGSATRRAVAGTAPDGELVHAVLLSPGVPPGPVWAALCGQRLTEAEVALVDHGVGEPCAGCLRRWIAHYNSPERSWVVPVLPTRTDQQTTSVCVRPREYGGAVEQRISLVTLGVRDLTRARRFYESLGWQGQETEETVFFQAECVVVVLWGRDRLAADAGVEDSGADGFGGMTVAHNVRSRTEVDTVMGEAVNAGAEITRPARETFYGGYAGCFTDPDGHVWEIAYNPGFPLGPDGAITLPDFSGS